MGNKLKDFRFVSLQSVKLTIKFQTRRKILCVGTFCQVIVEGLVTKEQWVTLTQKKIKVDKDFNFLVDYLKELEEILKTKHFKCLDFDSSFEQKNLENLKATFGQQAFVFYKGQAAKKGI